MIGQSRVTKVRLLGALAAVLAMGETAAAAMEPDLTGVWMIASPITELKTAEGKAPPLNKTAAAVYQRRLAQFKAGDRSFDPAARCISPGLPRILTLSYPFKIFQNDRHIFFSFQWNRWFRYAKLSKEQPDPPYPMSMGTAAARWEDGTLVIETLGLGVEDTLLDAAGMPHGENLHLTERLRKVGADTIEDRITITDPETFTHPWETVLRFTRQPAGTEISEDVCFDRTDSGEPAIKP